MPPLTGYHTMFDNPYWATGGNIQRGPSYTGGNIQPGPYTGGASPGQGGYPPYLPPGTPPIFYDGTLPGDPGTPGGRRLTPGDPNYGVTNPVRTPQPISVQPYAPPTQREIADRQNLFGSFGDFAPVGEPPGGAGAVGGGAGAVGGQGFNEWFGWNPEVEGSSFQRDDSPFGWAPPRWAQRLGSLAGLGSAIASGGATLPLSLASGSLTGKVFDATRNRNLATKNAIRTELGLPTVKFGEGENIDNAREIWDDLDAEVAAMFEDPNVDPRAAAGASMMLSQMQLGGDAVEQDESGRWGVRPMNLGGTYGTGVPPVAGKPSAIAAARLAEAEAARAPDRARERASEVLKQAGFVDAAGMGLDRLTQEQQAAAAQRQYGYNRQLTGPSYALQQQAVAQQQADAIAAQDFGDGQNWGPPPVSPALTDIDFSALAPPDFDPNPSYTFDPNPSFQTYAGGGFGVPVGGPADWGFR